MGCPRKELEEGKLRQLICSVQISHVSCKAWGVAGDIDDALGLGEQQLGQKTIGTGSGGIENHHIGKDRSRLVFSEVLVLERHRKSRALLAVSGIEKRRVCGLDGRHRNSELCDGKRKVSYARKEIEDMGRIRILNMSHNLRDELLVEGEVDLIKTLWPELVVNPAKSHRQFFESRKDLSIEGEALAGAIGPLNELVLEAPILPLALGMDLKVGAICPKLNSLKAFGGRSELVDARIDPLVGDGAGGDGGVGV